MKTYYLNGRVPFLELSDYHVLWEIDTKGHEFDVSLYEDNVEYYCKIFAEKFQTEIFLLGRSGRHVCVDYNEENIEKFDDMQEFVKKAQEEIIQNMNNFYENYKEN